MTLQNGSFAIGLMVVVLPELDVETRLLVAANVATMILLLLISLAVSVSLFLLM